MDDTVSACYRFNIFGVLFTGITLKLMFSSVRDVKDFSFYGGSEYFYFHTMNANSAVQKNTATRILKISEDLEKVSARDSVKI